MFITHRYKAFLYLKAKTFQQSPNPYPLFHHHYPSPFSIPFCTNTSHYSPSFPVSYLINNFGFSPQSASKLCSTYKLGFKTAKKPDAVLSFFRNRGFSDTQLHHMIQKAPWLLTCDPCKKVLPKFEFFHSKGSSTSDIINLISKNPYLLSRSPKNHPVPCYELVFRFLKSDRDTIAFFNYNTSWSADSYLSRNIRMLIENGVTESNIARMLRIGCMVFNTPDNKMLQLVMEVKDMGFHPSKSTFAIALIAKALLNKTRWNEKVDVFKKWGWSDEDILEAFRSYPHCMLASIDKINLVMSFWVNQLGWDSLALVKGPIVIGLSLERRIIPRASVLQYLLEKGMRKKNASLATPFVMTEKVFVDKFINHFMEDSSYLLKLYEEKLKLVSISDKTGMF